MGGGTPERPRVFVTRRLEGLGAPDVLDSLRARTRCDVWEAALPPAPDEMRTRLAGCQGLFCLLTDSIDRQLLESCRELRVVSSMSVGVDHVDVVAASARGIPVGYTPGVLVETTADLSFGLMLAAARRIPEADRFVREGNYIGASQQFAYASVLREQRGTDAAPLKEKLRDAAVAAAIDAN